MLNRAREWWEGLGRNNQIILIASTVGGLVALIGFIAWASTPEYVPLFSKLEAQDANAITDKLREANVPFHLTQGGTAIEVPAQNHDEMLMKLVSQGLPQQSTTATPGYELLDKANNFQTQNMESLMMQRAKEGEISKSILTLQQIAGATVHYAPPDETPFVRDKHDSSASVILTLKPGQTLTDENVHAIVRLVQMSYTGLNEKSISVVDAQGDLLFDGTRSADDGGDRMKLQHQMAQAKRSELQSLLDGTIGPHKAVVLCNVELTSDQETSEANTYESGPVINKTSETEKLNGTGSVHGGTPGANANMGGAPSAPGAPGTPSVPTYNTVNGADGNYNHETTSQTTQPSVTKTVVTKPAGRIQKLTVSALVDSKVPPDEVASITQVLKTAIGVDPNDPNRSVTVAQVPFDRTGEEAEKKAADAATSAENNARLLSLLVPLGLMMLCLFVLARALRKPRLARSGGQLALPGGGSMPYMLDASGQLVLGPDGTPMTSGMDEETTIDEHGNIIALSSSTGPKTFDVIEEAFDANLESILHLTKSKPETVAMLVKSWISEDAA